MSNDALARLPGRVLTRLETRVQARVAGLLTRPVEALVSTLQRGADPVIGEIVGCVVAAEVGGAAEIDPAAIGPAVEVMRNKVRSMPPHLGAGMVLFTHVFDAYGLVTGGRPFHSLSEEERRQQLSAWRESPIGFCRDFVDFYEKMGIFSYWSVVEEQEHP
jgi:hypothetical protein